MVAYSVFRSGVLACAAAALLPVWAQQASTQVVSGPTRMQRCQAEIGDLKGSARTLKLRKCLIDRTEGERLLTRDCNRQYRALPKGHSQDKVPFQRKCVAAGLNVGYEALPRRKPPAPDAQDSGAAATASQSAAGQPSAAKAPRAPASNAATPTASKSSDKPVNKPAPKPAAAPSPAPGTVSNTAPGKP
jgi:hypothetical protein